MSRNFPYSAFARLFTQIFFLLITTQISAQVVNIESRRMRTDSVRLAGFAHAAMALSNNDDLSLFQFTGQAAAQWKTKDLGKEVLFLASYSTSRSREVDYIDVLFGHLRFTAQINEFIRGEFFMQYQKNPPLGIFSRSLIGIGPRFKFLNTDNFSGYFGTHYMREIEVQEENLITLYHHRSSSYLSFTFKFPALKSELITTTYYQPEFGNPSDFRVSSENQLMLSIAENLVWTTDFQVFYDKDPPPGIRKRASSFRQGLKFQF